MLKQYPGTDQNPSPVICLPNLQYTWDLLNSDQSEGDSFFVESIYLVCGLTMKIEELPIFFSDRQFGTLKIF